MAGFYKLPRGRVWARTHDAEEYAAYPQVVTRVRGRGKDRTGVINHLVQRAYTFAWPGAAASGQACAISMVAKFVWAPMPAPTFDAALHLQIYLDPAALAKALNSTDTQPYWNLMIPLLSSADATQLLRAYVDAPQLHTEEALRAAHPLLTWQGGGATPAVDLEAYVTQFRRGTLGFRGDGKEWRHGALCPDARHIVAHYILATEHVLRELLPFATDVVLRETAITTRTLSAHDFVDALVAEFAAVLQSDAVPELADALRSAPTAGADGYTTVDDALWLEHVVRGPILERTADRLVRAVYWRIVYYETALGTLVAAEDRERTIAALRRLLVGSPYIVDWLTKSAKACQPLRAWVEAASDPDATEAQRQEARTLALQGRECGTFSLGTRLLSTTKVYGTGEAGVPFELFFLRTGGLPSSPEHIRTTDTAFAHAFDVTWSNAASRPLPAERGLLDSPLPEVAEVVLVGLPDTVQPAG